MNMVEWNMINLLAGKKMVALPYRIAVKKCQDEGIEPEPYEAPQTDDEAARDQQILDDIFDTCWGVLWYIHAAQSSV